MGRSDIHIKMAVVDFGRSMTSVKATDRPGASIYLSYWFLRDIFQLGCARESDVRALVR